MRWLTFLVLMIVALILQSALAPRIEIAGTRPDWLLVVVVFFAMHASAREALLGAWITGACADLLTIERFGVLALSYGAAAMLVLPTRDYIFRGAGWPQFLVTLGVCALIRTVWIVYYYAVYDPARSILLELAVGVLLASLYTALWAPLLHRALLPWWWTLGLPRPVYLPRRSK